MQHTQPTPESPVVDLKLQPKTDPVAVYRWRDGIYATDLLTAALIGLDFFTWLSTHPSDLAGVCDGLQVAERPADVMLTLFTAMGLIENRGGAFHVTPLAAEHLVRTSPWFLGPYYESLKSRPVTRDFIEIFRHGKPANWGSFKDERAWAQAMEEPAFAAQFTSAMDCRGVYLAQALAKTVNLGESSRLLDIAGGSGIYACGLAAHYPALTATVFEKPPVHTVAARLVAERGFSSRVQVVAGDMFVDWLPLGHDTHLYSNVLHDWDFPTVRQLLKSSFDALPAGGRLLVHDAYLDSDKTGPLHVAEYSALLMHSSEGKCYSIAEMSECLIGAGFVDPGFTPTAAARGVIVATKPAGDRG